MGKRKKKANAKKSQKNPKRDNVDSPPSVDSDGYLSASRSISSSTESLEQVSEKAQSSLAQVEPTSPQLELQPSKSSEALTEPNMDSTKKHNNHGQKSTTTIMAMDSNLLTIRNMVKSAGLSAQFKTCSIGIKIYAKTTADRHKIETLLNKGKINYFTHPEKTMKMVKFIIKGLPSLESSEVKADLKHQLGIEPMGVFPIGRSTPENCVFVVKFQKGAVNLDSLQTNIRFLCDVKIRWEPERPNRSNVTQCHRCLMFGHGASSCHLNPRCAKCGLAHLTTICEANCEFFCANCGGNHQANDFTCPERARFIEVRQKATTKATPSSRTAPSHKSHTRKKESSSFAEILANLQGCTPSVTTTSKTTSSSDPNDTAYHPVSNMQVDSHTPVNSPQFQSSSPGIQLPASQNPALVPTPAVSLTHTETSGSSTNSRLPASTYPTHVSSTHTSVTTGKNYARANIPPTQPQETSKNIFSAKELVNIFNNLLPALASCKSKAEQIHVLGTFIIQYVC